MQGTPGGPKSRFFKHLGISLSLCIYVFYLQLVGVLLEPSAMSESDVMSLPDQRVESQIFLVDSKRCYLILRSIYIVQFVNGRSYFQISTL